MQPSGCGQSNNKHTTIWLWAESGLYGKPLTRLAQAVSIADVSVNRVFETSRGHLDKYTCVKIPVILVDCPGHYTKLLKSVLES